MVNNHALFRLEFKMKVKKVERKNWFYSYDMIFEVDISNHAKLLYVYLCRCADGKSQSFPSHEKITKHCSVGETTAKKALDDLIKARLITKESRYRKDNGQTSNRYTIFPKPYNID